MALIQITDLTFTYPGSFDPVFEHVSFQLDTDWRLGLTGRNGRGKTTLLRLIAGLERPQRGEILRPAGARISFCFQEDRLLPWLTAEENLSAVGIDRGRAKAKGGVEQTKTWRNSFIFTGEEPITKGVSGGGVKNRVIEIECDSKIIKDGNYTANLVKANYGYAGKLFIAHLRDLIDSDKQSIVDEYKELFKGVLDATDTTDKQALSMALMLLADKLACECIFKDEPLSINDVKQYLIPESAVRIEDRAYDELVSLISRNINKFNEFSPDAWGRIADDVATINKQVLEQELAKMNFDFGSLKKGWDKMGYIIKNTAGRYSHQTRVNGIMGRYVKIQLPKEFEQVLDVPFEFEQQKLTL